MISRWSKKDMYGQVITPGDVCAYSHKGKVELVVYSKESWGGPGRKGEFGQFQTPRGLSSIKYTSVVLAYDPMSSKRNKSKEVTKLIKKFYEGNK